MQQLRDILTFTAPLAAIILLAACAAYMPPPPLPPTPTAVPGISIPYQTISQSGESRFQERNARLFVVETEAERNTLIELLQERYALDLLAVDLAENVILGVFRPPQASTGYRVDIQQIVLDENTVYVYTELSQPRPRDMTSPAETQPFHIVQIPRSALPDVPLEWVLVTYPIYTEWPPEGWDPPPSPLATPTDIPGASVAFDTVLSGYDAHFSGEAAQLLTAETETEAFAELVYGEDAQAALAAVNLDEHLLVGLFLPPRHRTGHALAITRILVQENKATVYAEVWEPQPSYFFGPAQLNLYHIVHVPRAALPAGEIEWELVTYPTYIYHPWLQFDPPGLE